MELIRSHFPQVEFKKDGKDPIVYLDSAATTLKPKRVIDRVQHSYSSGVANVHRGAHQLSDAATDDYEATRIKMAEYIRASHKNEVIFTKGTTESINLVAQSYVRGLLKPGDQILISEMEHHSNIVPWHIVKQQTGAEIVVLPVTDEGEWDLSAFEKILSPKIKFAALIGTSNTLGTVNPVKKVTKKLKSVGARVLVDGAQSLMTSQIDVQDWGCDFLALSGHKFFAPSGVGVLWGKEELLNQMPPYQAGGSMIQKVTLQESTFLEAPHRFEAGTPPITQVIGLGAALDFVKDIDLVESLAQEKSLLRELDHELESFSRVKKIGVSKTNINIRSFIVEGAHHSDVGTFLDQYGVAVRVGHHCTQPLMERFGIAGTVRVSLSLYNNKEDIQKFLTALEKTLQFV